jgi:hypothetical protein
MSGRGAVADEERGLRWWVRYAIVPLLSGGGLVVLLVTWFLGQKGPDPKSAGTPGATVDATPADKKPPDAGAAASIATAREAMPRADGWIYVGRWTGAWEPRESKENTTIVASNYPRVGAVYQLRVDANVRAEPPSGPDHHLATSLNILRHNSHVMVLKTEELPDNNWVWAQVASVPPPAN